MGVGSFLTFFVGAEGPLVFHVGSGGTKLAVGEDWEDDYVAGGVVSDEEEFAGFVEREIAGIFARGGELV